MITFHWGGKNAKADNFPRKDGDMMMGMGERGQYWYGESSDYDKRGNVTNFFRLSCQHCGSKLFEVLKTDTFETTARCPCGRYYVVHTG